MYSFDPVGSYEREACRAAGAAQSLVQPFLDNQASHSSHCPLNGANTRVISQVYFKNQTVVHGESFPSHLPLTSVLKLIVDAFTSATERHIEVRDISQARTRLMWLAGWRWVGDIRSAGARQPGHSGGSRVARSVGGDGNGGGAAFILHSTGFEEGLGAPNRDK